MTIDIRADIRCNLGPLISASISDDYIQGNGLIKTTGNCELACAITIAPGTYATFQYIRDGVTRTIPRTLRVISSSADPFRDTTTVELGCPLTYMENAQEPVNWDALDDPENSDLTQEDQNIVVLPIYASSIATECINKIGLSGSPPLTNSFSISNFDFSSGYVGILSDLLISECYCGYVDGTNVLQFFSTQNPTGSARIIDENEIIDISPLNGGEPEADIVIVNYTTLKLKQPDTNSDNVAVRNWEFEENLGALTEIIMEGEYYPSIPRMRVGGPWTNYFSYIPRSTTRSYYDSWDRLAYRITIEETIAAAANPEYVKQHISYFAYGPFGLYPIYKMTKTVVTYEKEAPESNPNPNYFYRKSTLNLPEGYDKVLREVTTTYEPYITKLGGVSSNYYDPVEDDFIQLGVDLPGVYQETVDIVTSVPDDNYISQRTTTYSETSSRLITIIGDNNSSQALGNFPITKTTTITEKTFSQTPRGLQFIAAATEEGKKIDEFAWYVGRLVEAGIETRTFSGREATFQGRPSPTDLSISSSSNGGDPNNGYQTESSSQIEFITGNTSGMRRTEFSMPYAPDDRFVKSGTGPEATFTAVESDAKQKAANFGRVQNGFLMGNRNGVGIQTSADTMPSEPFSLIAIKAKGMIGIYVTNGTSWVMDSNGIIASTDALLIGAYSKA